VTTTRFLLMAQDKNGSKIRTAKSQSGRPRSMDSPTRLMKSKRITFYSR
jgi:hypothetical protein